MMKHIFSFFLLFTLCVSFSRGQEETPEPAEEKLVIKSLGAPTGEDSFSIDMKEKVTVQGGGVSVSRGEVSLTCDSIVVYLEDEEVYAEGNVILTDGKLRITAEKVYYNFKESRGVLEKARVVSGLSKEGEKVQWIVGANKLIRESRDLFTAQKAYITTCPFKVPHYRLSCSSLRFIPGRMVTAKNMVLYLGKVPVFYYPWFRHDLQHNWLPYDFKLGSSSEWGDYLQTRWKLYSNDVLALLLRLDLTAKRGNGLGVDVEYDNSSGTEGMFTYYTVTDPLGYSRNRMMIDWEHYQRSEHSPYIFKADIYSYSDREFGDDFFDKIYTDQLEYTPFLQARQLFDMGELDLIYAFRTDAFQDEVRFYKPALFFGLGPFELYPGGYLTFETHNSQTGLAYDEVLGIPDIERERFFARLAVSQYTDIGPLRCDIQVGETVGRYDDYLVPVDTSFRHQLFCELEIGTMLSADFKTKIGNLSRLRHTIEPYLRFYRGFSTSVENSAVDQLDLYDDVREDMYIRPGFRTGLQGKDPDGYRDLAYFEAWFRYYDNDTYAALNNGGENWGDIGFRLSISPVRGLGFYSQGIADPGDVAFEELYSGVRYRFNERLAAQLEDYRSLNGRGSVFGIEAAASEKWSMGAFLRYDALNENYAEWRWFATRIFHMWELTFIGRYEREDDDRSYGVKLKLINGDRTDISSRQAAVIAPDRIDDYLFFGEQF